MQNNLFIPKKLKIGFNIRKDTYTGKLAYVIYYDNKNKLRKATSWESWRDNNIDPLEIENTPRSGFVLNKKVGGNTWSGWNPRQTYVRVYDPEGFEFEITIPNLLYILENVNSIKGKGLEGEFVYAWQGKELVLLPTNTPDYKAIINYNKKIFNPKKFNKKNMVEGSIYLSNFNTELLYMGYHELYNYWYYWNNTPNGTKSKGKYHWFYNIKSENFEQYKSLTNKIIDLVDDKYEEFPTIYNKLLDNYQFNPVIDQKIVMVDKNIIDQVFLQLQQKASPSKYEFKFILNSKSTDYWDKFYNFIRKLKNGKYYINRYLKRQHSIYPYKEEFFTPLDNKKQYDTIQELLDDNLPMYTTKLTLKNGKEIYHEK